MTRFTRRAASVLLAIVLIVVMAGLPAARAARSGAGTVVVDYWSNMCWQPAHQDLLSLAAAFNKSHPGIDLKPTCFSNANVLQPRLLAAIQAHHPPALSQTDAFAVSSYVDEKAVQDLTPYINGPHGFSAEQLNDFFGPMVQNGRSLP